MRVNLLPIAHPPPYLAMICRACDVEWIGPDLPCWNCGEMGERLHPPKEEV